jgi:MFS family permease
MSLLSNRNFLLLTAGSGISQVGSQIAFVATIYWLRQTTDSATLIGLLATTAAIPLLLLSPLGGVFADRWQRRKILIVCDAICCLLCFSLMFFAGSTTLPGLYVIAGVFLSHLFLSSCNAFTNPALNALVPDVVQPEQVEKAIGFTQAFSLIAVIGGQALGALLLDHYSPATLFAIDGVTYISSAAALLLMRAAATSAAPERAERSSQRLIEDIRSAAEYIWRRPGMRLVLLAAIPVSIFTDTILVFLSFYTTNNLGEPLSRYAYLLACFSCGLFLGYAWIARSRMPADRKSTVVISCIVASATVCMSLAFIHTYWLASVLLLLFGSFTGAVSLLCMNALLSQTDRDKRGRVAAVLIMITQGITPLTMALLGIVVDELKGNLAPLYASCGLALLITGLMLFSSRDLRFFLSGRLTVAS